MYSRKARVKLFVPFQGCFVGVYEKQIRMSAKVAHSLAIRRTVHKRQGFPEDDTLCMNGKHMHLVRLDHVFNFREVTDTRPSVPFIRNGIFD